MTARAISLSGAQQFLRSYLVGFWFWFGMGLGCLVLLMIQFVTGGAWGMMIRRPLEAGTRTLYVMWLLFLPLLILAPQLYLWADPAQASRQDRSGQASLPEPAVSLDSLADLWRRLAGSDVLCSTNGRCSKTKRNRW